MAIQRHPFFKEIDWQILEERRVRPPFRPKVRSRIDTSNFDKVCMCAITLLYKLLLLFPLVPRGTQGFSQTSPLRLVLC
ncbi:unnamed protein product [Trichobilharzia regenti]|nr:unnamed protein product [Trichobilharzia regenti]